MLFGHQLLWLLEVASDYRTQPIGAFTPVTPGLQPE